MDVAFEFLRNSYCTLFDTILVYTVPVLVKTALLESAFLESS